MKIDLKRLSQSSGHNKICTNNIFEKELLKIKSYNDEINLIDNK